LVNIPKLKADRASFVRLIKRYRCAYFLFLVAIIASAIGSLTARANIGTIFVHPIESTLSRTELRNTLSESFVADFDAGPGTFRLFTFMQPVNFAVVFVIREDCDKANCVTLLFNILKSPRPTKGICGPNVSAVVNQQIETPEGKSWGGIVMSCEGRNHTFVPSEKDGFQDLLRD
jgi:hypothetical protein